jgi:hypothetical protein
VSLAKTQDQIKRGFAFVAIAFLTYYTGKYAIKGGIAIYKLLNPAPPPGPTLAFGKMPHAKISSLPFDNEGVIYSLDTVEGNLPLFPNIVTAFKIDEPQPDLLSGSKARNLALSLGFKNAQKELSKVEYLWEDPESTRNLKINIASGNFKLESDGKYLYKNLVRGETYIESEAITRAKNMLSGKGILPETIENGIQKPTLVEITEDGKLKQALSLSNAQMVKVDFFRNLKFDSKTYPVFGPEKKANVSVYLTSPNDKGLETPLLYYTTWNPVLDNRATYPAKPIDVAWNEITNGQASIAELRIKDSDPFSTFRELAVKQVIIRDVYMSYYEDKNFQEYMLPIYVFEGEAQTKDNQRAYFTAFTWAVDETWLREGISQ